MKCLCCEKVLGEMYAGRESFTPEDGGRMMVSFGYGSRHDQGGSGPAVTPIDKLLNCNEIEAYICDDCFEKKFDLMNGFSVKKTVTRDLEFESK